MINFYWPTLRIFQPSIFTLAVSTRTIDFCWIQNKREVKSIPTQSWKRAELVCKRFSTDTKISAVSEMQPQDEVKAKIGRGYNETMEGNRDGSVQTKHEENHELIFKEIANGDESLERQLKILAFEISVFRERFTKVPTVLKKKHWIKLLKLNSWAAKRHYLYYLFRTEKSNENTYEKKKNKVYHRHLLWAKESENHHLPYSLKDNSMFLRIYNQSLIRLLQHRTMAASLYSQHLVFDCSYVDYMSDLNIQFCAKQILFAYSSNRLHVSPFHLKLCNFNKNDYLSKMLAQFLCCTSETFPIDVDSKSFLDIYPKEKLVYLTPHCREALKTFNFDDIYIIGAYVDRGLGRKLSLAKAKDMNLRMAKLPLDNYLNWQKGGKSLPLNIVLDILLDLKYYRDWSKAFKNVPARCKSN